MRWFGWIYCELKIRKKSLQFRKKKLSLNEEESIYLKRHFGRVNEDLSFHQRWTWSTSETSSRSVTAPGTTKNSVTEHSVPGLDTERPNKVYGAGVYGITMVKLKKEGGGGTVYSSFISLNLLTADLKQKQLII